MAAEFLCQALALVDALHAVGSLGGHWRPFGMDKLARFVAVKGSAKKSDAQVDMDRLGWWLCERQTLSGGFNGRPEKAPMREGEKVAIAAK